MKAQFRRLTFSNFNIKKNEVPTSLLPPAEFILGMPTVKNKIKKKSEFTFTLNCQASGPCIEIDQAYQVYI